MIQQTEEAENRIKTVVGHCKSVIDPSSPIYFNNLIFRE